MKAVPPRDCATDDLGVWSAFAYQTCAKGKKKRYKPAFTATYLVHIRTILPALSPTATVFALEQSLPGLEAIPA